jgi:hypothetical protein
MSTIAVVAQKQTPKCLRATRWEANCTVTKCQGFSVLDPAKQNVVYLNMGPKGLISII